MFLAVREFLSACMKIPVISITFTIKQFKLSVLKVFSTDFKKNKISDKNHRSSSLRISTFVANVQSLVFKCMPVEDYFNSKEFEVFK